MVNDIGRGTTPAIRRDQAKRDLTQAHLLVTRALDDLFPFMSPTTSDRLLSAIGDLHIALAALSVGNQ